MIKTTLNRGAMLLLAAIISAGALTACSREEAKPAPKATAPATPAEPTLPAGLIVATEPADAKPVSEVRKDAGEGDEVVLTGYIGGRKDPFTAGRAMFLLADNVEAPACTDSCAIPWDACCTPRATITANSTLVQVVDEQGEPLRLELNGVEGFKPGAVLTVAGRVRSRGENSMIVDMKTVYIAK